MGAHHLYHRVVSVILLTTFTATALRSPPVHAQTGATPGSSDSNGSSIRQEQDRLILGVQLAGALGATPEQIRTQLLPQAEALARRLQESQHADAKEFQKKLVRPLKKVLETSDALRLCGEEAIGQQTASALLAGIRIPDAGDCTLQRIELSEALLKLTQSVDPAVASARQSASGMSEAEMAKKFHDALVAKTRAETLGLYASVRSRFTEKIPESSPENSEEALRAIYARVSERGLRDWRKKNPPRQGTGRGAYRATQRRLASERARGAEIGEITTRALEKAKKDAIVTRTLAQVARDQPESDAKRQELRSEYFKQTQADALTLWRERDAVARLRPQADATRDWVNMRWLREPYEPSRVEQESQRELLQLGRLWLDTNPVRDARYLIGAPQEEPWARLLNPEPPQLRVSRPTERTPVGGFSLPEVLTERYGLEVKEWKNRPRDPLIREWGKNDYFTLLARDFERLQPGQGEALAHEFLNEMDLVFGVEQGSSGGAVPGRTLRLAPGSRTLSESRLLDLMDGVNARLRLNDRAPRQLEAHRNALDQTRARLRQNPLTWQENTPRNLTESGIYSAEALPEHQLEGLLAQFYESSERLLLAIDEDMASQDPRESIKSAMKHNPSVVAAVLAENPELAPFACTLSKEAASDQKSNAFWDAFWGTAGFVLFVGLTIVSGGAALLGAGAFLATVAAVGGGAGLLLGAGSLGWSAHRSHALAHEANQAKMHLEGLGIGDREEIEKLFEQSNEQFTQAVISGALLPLDVFSFYKGLKGLSGVMALRELRTAARGGENLIELARRARHTRAREIVASLSKNDRASVTAAERTLGRALSDEEQVAFLAAHEVGNARLGADGINPAGIGNYTQEQIAEKARILADLKKPDGTRAFSQEDVRRLMEAGHVGLPATPLIATQTHPLKLVSTQNNEHLLGKEAKPPDAGTIRFYRQEIFSIRDAEQLPRADFPPNAPLTLLENAGGYGNNGVYRANLNGQSVAVKTLNPMLEGRNDPLKESRWYLYLNKLGLGPEFKGVTQTTDGTQALVTEFIEGTTTNQILRNGAPEGIDLLKAAKEVREAGRRIKAAGIEYAPDLQFIITRDGRAVLIDPEFFEFKTPFQPRTHMPGDPIANAEALAEKLEALAQKKNKPSLELSKTGTQVASESPTSRIIIPGQAQPNPDLRLILPNNATPELTLGRVLSTQERQVIQRAHEVGLGQIGRDGINPAGIGNYTQEQIAEKARILADLKKPDGTRAFSQEDVRRLMEAGHVGVPPGRQPLTGMANLTPGTADLQQVQTRIFSIQSSNYLPQADFPANQKFDLLPDAGGSRNAGIYSTELGGRKLAIKTLDAEAPIIEQDALRESKWYLFLNKLGMGPQFRGVTRSVNGTPALVTDFVEGWNTKQILRSQKIPDGVDLERAAREIRETAKKLKDAGVNYTPDLQFMITPEGRAVLIDPQTFSFNVPRNRSNNWSYDPIENAEYIARDLEKLASQRKPGVNPVSGAQSASDLASNATQPPRFTVPDARSPRTDIPSNPWDNLVRYERSRFSNLDWKTLSDAEKTKLTKEMVDEFKKVLTERGFTVEPKLVDGLWRLEILSVPERTGRFLGRVERLYGTSKPKIEYVPSEIAGNAGAGGQTDIISNSIQVDATMLSAMDRGSLQALKHELRHGRQGIALNRGEINSFHGWIAFADEAPRRDLGIYDLDFQADEVMTYSRQQLDNANELRREIDQMRAQGAAYLENPRNSLRLQAIIKQADRNYYTTTNMNRALQETTDIAKKGLSQTARTEKVISGANTEITHFFGSGNDQVKLEFFTDARLGPNGAIGVVVPSTRRGTIVLANGKAAEDLIVIPTPSIDKMKEFQQNPELARQYVLNHLRQMAESAEGAKNKVVERQRRVVTPLIQEAHDLVNSLEANRPSQPLIRPDRASAATDTPSMRAQTRTPSIPAASSPGAAALSAQQATDDLLKSIKIKDPHGGGDVGLEFRAGTPPGQVIVATASSDPRKSVGVGAVVYDVNSSGTMTIQNFYLRPENIEELRGRDIGTLMMAKALKENPNVRRIAGNLVSDNENVFRATLEKLARKKLKLPDDHAFAFTLAASLRQMETAGLTKAQIHALAQEALKETPAYKLRARFGFTRIVEEQSGIHYDSRQGWSSPSLVTERAD